VGKKTAYIIDARGKERGDEATIRKMKNERRYDVRKGRVFEKKDITLPRGSKKP